MTIQQTDQPTPRKPLLLWPGVLAGVLLLLLRFVVPKVVTEGLMVGMFGGLGCALARARGRRGRDDRGGGRDASLPAQIDRGGGDGVLVPHVGYPVAGPGLGRGGGSPPPSLRRSWARRRVAPANATKARTSHGIA